MTPYELRFQIFESARTIAENRYYSQREEYDKLKEEQGEAGLQLPKYPSVRDITYLADEINMFVSYKPKVS